MPVGHLHSKSALQVLQSKTGGVQTELRFRREAPGKIKFSYSTFDPLLRLRGRVSGVAKDTGEGDTESIGDPQGHSYDVDELKFTSGSCRIILAIETNGAKLAQVTDRDCERFGLHKQSFKSKLLYLVEKTD